MSLALSWWCHAVCVMILFYPVCGSWKSVVFCRKMCFLTLFCGFRGVVLSVLWCKIVKVRVQDSQSCALTLSFLRGKIDYLAWRNAMFSDFPGDFSGWRRMVFTSNNDIYRWFTIHYIKTLVKLEFPPKNLVVLLSWWISVERVCQESIIRHENRLHMILFWHGGECLSANKCTLFLRHQKTMDLSGTKEAGSVHTSHDVCSGTCLA